MSNGRIQVICDTREQTPWQFDADRFEVTRSGLETGDYSIKGFENQICIERKSLGDCVQTVISGWLRFRKELYRMSGMDQAIIVVEASIDDIVNKRYESDANPASVLGKLISITLDHGIPVVFAGNREDAMLFADRYLTQAFAKAKR